MIKDLEIQIQENINNKTRRFGVFLTRFSRYSTGKLLIDTLSDGWLKHFYIRDPNQERISLEKTA